MAEEEAEKTETATPKRREEARNKGEVAQSREIQHVVILTAAMLALGSSLGIGVVTALSDVARSSWSAIGAPPETLADFRSLLLGHVSHPALAVLPIMLLFAAAGTASQVLQTGPLLSSEALAFKANRMSPLQGAKRMFSPDRLFDLVKAILKVSIVGTVGWSVIGGEMDLVIGLADTDIGPGLATIGLLSRRLAIAILSVLALMAAADLFYQRWRYEKRLRMSKREVREEVKQREGNPHVRSRFRQMQRELSRSRMISAVADADVVLTNPTHYAVALRYDREIMGAPEVVAKGRGHVAKRIRQAAEDADIPIVENPPLARMLHQTTEVGQPVPDNLFQAVAEVLAYIYRLDPRRAVSWGAAS
ncbi:MAG: flagellar biosynthesis protein FlhB [bacterium]|nr:flagellar biosynthesis protein FlhB [bacterium]